MDNIGGSEIVALTLARELQADIYTTNINKERIVEMGFSDLIERIHSIGRVPIQAPFRHQSSLYRFRRLNLRDRYSFFILSGDWAMSGGVQNYPNIWYAHSPLHEIWAFVDKIKMIIPKWQHPAYTIWVHVNRLLTKSYAKHINGWVCNSKNTKERIRMYYKKDANIIHPPTYTSTYAPRQYKDYWLSVNRLNANKRIEIQLEAFKKLPTEKLIIVGSYEKGAKQFESYKNFLESIKPDNVEIRHWVRQEELIRLYAECKGHIITSEREDFGMTAIEAMASGKYVIAPDEGGYKETILTGITGRLIKNINADTLKDTVLETNEILKNQHGHIAQQCILQASKYNTSSFVKAIREKIHSVLDSIHEKEKSTETQKKH